MVAAQLRLAENFCRMEGRGGNCVSFWEEYVKSDLRPEDSAARCFARGSSRMKLPNL